MEKIRLGDVCKFSEEKIAVANLNETNYISTENLLPNKGGIVPAATLPKTLTTRAFCAGDILISNIRPYFKKIWYATFDGGCSADILVLKAAENIDQKFLYYVLSEDRFFDYATATAKGTKMPRGDKLSIMNYPVPIFPLETQKKIGEFLYLLDKKIALNKKINATLEAMTKMIYEYYFVQFDFPDENGNPYKAGGGKMIFNDKIGREIPASWEVKTVGEIIIEQPKSKIQVNEVKNIEGDFPFFTSGDSILKWKEAFVDGRNCFLNTGGNVGIKFYVGQAAYSTDTWCIGAKENLTDYLYLFLMNIRAEIGQKFFQGTGLKHLQKPLFKQRAICIPPKNLLEKFNSEIQANHTKISVNNRESKKLAALRDYLLPLLMNGQIKIKE